MVYFQCFPPGLRRPALRHKKHGWGFVSPDVIVPRTPLQTRESFPASALLPDGMGQPPLVSGGIQHVDTPGVHMLGHLEDAIELVIQGRFASRPRQRVVT
jgi:hypothetical protein